MATSTTQLTDSLGNPLNVGGNVTITRQLTSGVPIAQINGEQLFAPSPNVDPTPVPIDPTNPIGNVLRGGGYASIFEKIGFIGDSLTAGNCNYDDNGSGQSGEYPNAYTSYGSQLCKMCGNTANILATGGLTTRTWLSSWGVRTEFLDNPCNAYIIALGVNDRNYYNQGSPRGVPVGSASDIGTETDSYYGNYARIIELVKSVQPKAKIFVMTDPKGDNSVGGYNDAVRYMSTYFENVYLIDLRTYAYDIFKDFKNGSGYWHTYHSTALGYRYEAELVASYIDWIIRMNPMDFEDVQFIGTNYVIS